MKKLFSCVIAGILLLAFPVCALAAESSSDSSEGFHTFRSVAKLITTAAIIAVPILIRFLRRKYLQGQEPRSSTNNTPHASSTSNVEPSEQLPDYVPADELARKRLTVAKANGFKDFASMVSASPQLDRNMAFAASKDDLDAVARAYGYVTFDLMVEAAVQKEDQI